MKNQFSSVLILGLLTLISFLSPLQVKAQTARIFSQSTTYDNLEEVLDEVMTYYQSCLNDGVPGLLPYETANQLIKTRITTLLDTITYSSSMYPGEVEFTGDYFEGDPLIGRANFRWPQNPHTKVTFYGEYIELTSGINMMFEDTVSGISCEIRETVMRKIFFLNARNYPGQLQSGYSIIIIEKDAGIQGSPSSLTGGVDPQHLRQAAPAIVPEFTPAHLAISPNLVSNATTQLEYTMAQDHLTTIRIHEGSTGQLVKTILPQQLLSTGQYQQNVDLTDFAPGLYYVILQTENQRIVKKLLKL